VNTWNNTEYIPLVPNNSLRSYEYITMTESTSGKDYLPLEILKRVLQTKDCISCNLVWNCLSQLFSQSI